jgi:hypothetical protein
MRLHGCFRPSAAWRVRIAPNLKGLAAEAVCAALPERQPDAEWPN